MKNKKLIKILIVLGVLAVGALIAGVCFFRTSVRANSDSDVQDNAAVNEAEKPAIKQVKITDHSVLSEVKEYDEDGKILKQDYYENGTKIRTSFTFTYEGENLVSEVVEKDNGTFDYKKKKYDEDGNLIEVYRGKEEDKLYLDEKNTYEDGLIRKRINYNEDGSIWDYHEYEYENGRLVKDTTKLESDYIYRTYEYVYDENGKLDQMTDTMHEHKSVCTYDDEERLVFEQNYYNGEPSFTTEYKYGEYGETEYIYTDSDGKVTIHTIKDYDDKGRLKCASNVDENGTKTIYATWEYDEAGNLLHHVDMSGYEYTAEYNEYGYPVKVHDVCTDMMRNAGRYDYLYEYEYTYY